MTTYTLADQIAAVKREIAMRESLFPKWVAQGRMIEAEAIVGIAVMRAVLETLKGLAIDEPLPLFNQPEQPK
ncbi:MAG: hypothetical protein R3E87_15095 [Burkholderiaceae bacterium]